MYHVSKYIYMGVQQVVVLGGGRQAGWDSVWKDAAGGGGGGVVGRPLDKKGRPGGWGGGGGLIDRLL